MKLPGFYRRFRKRLDLKSFHRQMVAKSNLCYDIGANLGERTDTFLSLGANVIVVEPQSSCVAYLRKKYKNNAHVTIVHAAVANYLGKAELHICNQTNECATLSDDFRRVYGEVSHLNWRNSETVDVVTLDWLIEKFGLPRFCKIDVEGFESKVVEGLSQPIEFLSLEVNQQLLSDSNKALRALNEIGLYEANFIEYEYLRWVNDDWLGLDFFCDQLEEFFPPERLTGEVFVRQFHR